MKNKEISSFRDPSGYVYYENNKVKRCINPSYFKEYEHLMNSGLYEELVEKKLIVSHKEIEKNNQKIIIEVEKIPYISYAYEWTFEQLKDAALLTLEVCKIAMKYGMILKDASCFNIQFLHGKAIFIDTLSFMFYTSNSPWGAYGQFTRHFISPLVLMKYKDIRLNCLLRDYIDGIPLDLCSNLLGHKGGMIASLHIKMQNKSIQKHNLDGHQKVTTISISKEKIMNMLDMIERQITGLRINSHNTEWDQYYQNTNYSDEAMKEKEKLVREFVSKVKYNSDDIIFDLGSNDGKFSRIALDECGKPVISFDIDSNAVSRNYVISRGKEEDIYPLLLDINNPSSSCGFASVERGSFMDRGEAKMTLALALIHHLAISNNLSFEMIRDFFYSITKYLVIEFVPKEDSQVEVLLNSRRDIFDFYDIDTFKKVFSESFKIIEEKKIRNSKRTMFLMEAKNDSK